MEETRHIRRQGLAISMEILSLCKTPQLKTHIMYQCNLSHPQLNDQLTYLLSKKLLEIKEIKIVGTHRAYLKDTYVTTEKGKKAISHFEAIKELV